MASERGQEAQKINIPFIGCQDCSPQCREEMLRDVTACFAAQKHFHLLPKNRNTANTQYLANRKNTNGTFFTVQYCAVKLHVLVWVWWRPLPPLEDMVFCHALQHFYQELPLPSRHLATALNLQITCPGDQMQSLQKWWDVSGGWRRETLHKNAQHEGDGTCSRWHGMPRFQVKRLWAWILMLPFNTQRYNPFPKASPTSSDYFWPFSMFQFHKSILKECGENKAITAHEIRHRCILLTPAERSKTIFSTGLGGGRAKKT